MKKGFFVLAVAVWASPLIAQKDTAVLDEVVVTANKMEQKQSRTGKVVTVIGRDVLERNAGKTLGQVLNEQVGLNIVGAYQTPGSVQTVFLRGASSGRTLILLDGIPVYDPSLINNEFDINLISLNDVERIEICRGAQSTLYGSDAIGGAINIITAKKDQSKPFQGTGLLQYGKLNTGRANVKVYGRIVEKLTYSGGFAKMTTDGFSAAHDKNNTGRYDDDKFNGNMGNFSLNYQIAPSLSARAYILNSEYKGDIDNAAFRDDKDYTLRNQSLYSGGAIQWKKGKLNLTANVQWGNLKRRYIDDSLFVGGFAKYSRNIYNGNTRFAELYGNIRILDWLTLLAGTDYRKGSMKQDFLSISSFGPYTSKFENKWLEQISGYGSVFLNFLQNNLTIELGARYNDHSRYGNNTTFTFNPSYLIKDRIQFFGSIATGFKAPSVFQIYDAFSGNQNLKPEKSVNYELGANFLHPKIRSRLVYFHREITDGIDYNYVTFKYFNLLKQTVNGAEVELNVTPVKGLQITSNYTFLNAEEKTQSRRTFKDTTYSYLLRRPRHHLNLTLGYQFAPSLFASVSAKAVSKRFDVGGFRANDVEVGGFFLLNAYAEYEFGKQVRLFMDLQNITNKTFFEINGYNAIPFLASGGLSFRW
ncbi:MAG: TonB-dependent receptor [Chitinophagaceae bacterium]|nr:TonB-dependent receptor [Chitinophagaceae bacterium]